MNPVAPLKSYTSTTLVGCKVCTGCVYLLAAIAVTILVAVGGGQSPPYSKTLCGFEYDTYHVSRNTTLLHGGVPPVNGGVASPAFEENTAFVNIFWYAALGLWWDAIWMLVVPLVLYFYGTENAFEAMLTSDTNRYRWYHYALSMPVYTLVLVFIAGESVTHVHWLVVAAAFAIVAQLAALESWVARSRSRGSVAQGRRTATNGWLFVAVVALIWLVLLYVQFSSVANTTAAANILPRTVTYIWLTSIVAYALYFFVFVLAGVVAHFFFEVWTPFAKELLFDAFYFVWVASIVGFSLGFGFGNCPPVV